MVVENIKKVSNRKRKEGLLVKAAQLFAEKGYQSSSVQEVAEHLGLSKGGLYWHWKSKEELYIEVCRYNCINSVSYIEDILSQSHLSLDLFYAKNLELLELYLKDEVQINLVVDFYAESRRSDVIHSELKRLMVEREKVLTAMLERFRDNDLFAPVDIPFVVSNFFTVFLGLLFKYMVSRDGAPILKEYEQYLKNTFRPNES